MEKQNSIDTAIGINMLLGLWTFVSPFLLGFRSVLPAAWNNVAVGLSMAALCGVRLSIGYNQPGWSWGTALLGVWLVVSPFVLGFTHISHAMWNNIIIGAIAVFLSWQATSIPEPRRA